VGAVLSFVQGILVARWLGPELYGVAALVMSVPSLVYTFFDARSAEASVKFLSEFDARGERERALAMCKVGYMVDFTIAMMAFLVILLLSPWAAKSIVKRPEMGWLIILYGSAFLPRALTGTSYAVLATLGRFPTIALIDTLTNILRVGLVMGLVGLGWQVAGVVWGNAIAMAATGLLYGILAYSLVKSRWGRSWLSADWAYLKGLWREVISFLAYNDLNALLGLIPKQLDVVILGYFRNPIEVGYYKLAKTLAGAVGYVVGPLQSVVYPEFAKLWGIGDMKAFRQKTRKLALQVGLPLAAVTACGVMLLPFILPALLGQSYDPAVPAAQLLLLGSAIWLGFFWLKPVYFAHGAIKQWSLVIGTFSLATFVGWLLIVPFYGFIGMSIWWTTSVALVYVGLGVSVYYVQFADSRLIPDWDEYTSQLVLKRAITGTNVDLLKNYARGKVLDAGCGTGIRLNQVATWSGVELAVGVDIGMPGLRYAKQNCPAISVICASVYNLPFKDEQFDFIYSIDVVEHLDDPQNALKEFYRVCKTNAYLFIQTPNYPIKRLYDFLHFLKGSRDTLWDDPTHVSKLNSNKLVKLLVEVGFKVEQVQARNILFEKYLPWLKKLKLNPIGVIIGQKVIIIAHKA
jgi:O-antigen/teichoic acid export membrane protein/ubiquinone/menaquinone biosynthesis C-methylase UbiE